MGDPARQRARPLFAAIGCSGPGQAALARPMAIG